MEKRSSKVPHQDLDFRPVHITYRLAGSLPNVTLSLLREKHEFAKRELELDSKKVQNCSLLACTKKSFLRLMQILNWK
ncbi:hypothetical protein SAMN05444359_101399 [Neolewinella agarilytica]|uniref:Uncharacterized protein n=1 Tax=Neolewinella agarilytica TaxID=478744 RepID=A0A1H8ZP78_9BACT|nr:hypothetical protein SAMN05444359_101399 [Neolewinella agarilytica]